MKRLLFLALTQQQAVAVVGALMTAGIERESIHVIADDASQPERLGLHPATTVTTTEMENEMDWGMVAGGSLGLAAGITASSTLAPLGLLFGGGVIFLSSMVGIGLGGWLGKLVGEETPVHLLQKYQHALQQGGFLVLVDIPTERMSEIHKVIRHHCPKALVEVIHPHWDYQQVA